MEASIERLTGAERHATGLHGRHSNEEGAVINTLMRVSQPLRVIGVHALDPVTEIGLARPDGMAWILTRSRVASSVCMTAQHRAKPDHRCLHITMMAVMWDRMPYLGPLLSTEVLPLKTL